MWKCGFAKMWKRTTRSEYSVRRNVVYAGIGNGFAQFLMRGRAPRGGGESEDNAEPGNACPGLLRANSCEFAN